MTILPSDCTAIVLTCALGFGAKLASTVPSVFNRAKKLRPVEVAEVLEARPGVYALNKPPTRILPSLCSASAVIEELGEGSNAVSSVPLAFSRSRFERAVAALAPTGVTEENVPPTTMRPSDCRAIAPT